MYVFTISQKSPNLLSKKTTEGHKIGKKWADFAYGRPLDSVLSCKVKPIMYIKISVYLIRMTFD